MIVGLSCVPLLLASCSASRVTTNTARTATQQLLVTEAADRSLRGLPWPSLSGREVFVETVSTGAREDEEYLQAAAEARLATEGAFVVAERKVAEFLVTLVVGSLGTDERQETWGLPSMQSLLMPVPFPEISFYKVTRQEGFAKTELIVRDAGTGAILHHSGPARGVTFATEYSILFFSFHRTNTTRDTSGTSVASRGSSRVAPAPGRLGRW